MSSSRASFVAIVCVSVTTSLVASCAEGPSADPAPAAVDVRIGALTPAEKVQLRKAACAKDPRVMTGLVSQDICVGADIFLRETFDGNGRTCGTCHPPQNNFTIDAPFITTLPQSDPLFVFKTNAALTELEREPSLLLGGILENVDDPGTPFADPTHKFSIRSVPHVLSMRTSVTADAGDLNTTTPPLDRTGWAGDGGALHDFLNTAITQHYPKTLARVKDADFRLAIPAELDLVDTFQRNLGRISEPNLPQVNLSDPAAQAGRDAYLDPMRGRCNACHLNGGANFDLTNKNRNFDTKTRTAQQFPDVPFFAGVFLFDGGFGGKGLAQPNFPTFDVNGSDTPDINNGFGNGSFSTPPVIEAADTMPAFHTNAFGAGNFIEGVVGFYATDVFFLSSPAAAELDARFGAPVNITGDDISNIGRFLRALNVALNLDMAKQRLRASQTILNRFHEDHAEIQKQLIRLAREELDDALAVLTSNFTPQPFYPVSVDRINLAKNEIAAALAAATSGARQGPLSNAISRVENARDQLGANINFQLGQGNLMF
jgi:cytochrome c peroxidase